MRPPQLYREWRKQARLLAYIWDDAQVYASHAFLARAAVRKPGNARSCIAGIRALAHANAGWPHAVDRALEQAYGRRGRLRHALLRYLLPTNTSDEPRSLRRMRAPQLTPLMHALLYSPAGRRDSPPPVGTHLRPPKLARAEAIVRDVPGKTVARRRVANAQWRWLADHTRRINPPLAYIVHTNTPDTHAHDALVRSLEARACTQGTPVPRRVGAASARTRKPTPSYIPAAKRAMLQWCTVRPHEKVRRRGWSMTARDYEHAPRARRRKLARLLATAPIVELTGDAPLTPTPARRLPGRLNRLRRIGKAAAALPATVHVSLSEHALRRNEPPRDARATDAELEWLALDK